MKTNIQDIKDLSIKYSNINAIPSREEAVAQEIIKDLEGMKNISFERDGMGSLAVIKKSNNPSAPTITITSHMDEIGFMITDITKEGYIKFQPLGSWWRHVVLAQRVLITTRNGDEIIGVIANAPSPKIRNAEIVELLKFDELFIDVGYESQQEVEALGISIGDMVTPYQDTATVSANQDVILGKAHDNRISIVTNILLLRELEDKELDVNLIFVASSQEEVGLRGARTSSYKWKSDLAIVLDIANGFRSAHKSDKLGIGRGPAFTIFNTTSISNYSLLNDMRDCADRIKIPYGMEYIRGGSDAGAVQSAKDGCPTVSVSIPTKYAHTHNSFINVHDVSNTVKLFKEYISDLTVEKVEEIKF